MFALLALLVTLVATGVGFHQAREFVRRRLRWVDAVHRTRTHMLIGGAAALVAAPVVWLLPLLGTWSAVLFGIGVGTGVRAGSREIRGRLPHRA